MPGFDDLAKKAKGCVFCGNKLQAGDVVFVTSHDPVLIRTCVDVKKHGVALVVSRLVFDSNVNAVSTLHRCHASQNLLTKTDCSGVTLCRAWSIEADGAYLIVRAGSVL